MFVQLSSMAKTSALGSTFKLFLLGRRGEGGGGGGGGKILSCLLWLQAPLTLRSVADQYIGGQCRLCRHLLMTFTVVPSSSGAVDDQYIGGQCRLCHLWMTCMVVPGSIGAMDD